MTKKEELIVAFAVEQLAYGQQRALDYGIYNYKIIQTILKKGMDLFSEENSTSPAMPLHDNIQGESYYQ